MISLAAVAVLSFTTLCLGTYAAEWVDQHRPSEPTLDDPGRRDVKP
jgi:hypothetical protein